MFLWQGVAKNSIVTTSQMLNINSKLKKVLYMYALYLLKYSLTRKKIRIMHNFIKH